MEYSAAGIIGAYSKITPYTTSITHGSTGLLVNNTAEDWYKAMKQLITSSENISSMTKKARTEVKNQHSVQISSCDYTKVFSDLIGQEHIHNPISSLPLLPTILNKTATKYNNQGRSLLNRHLLWRFKK